MKFINLLFRYSVLLLRCTDLRRRSHRPGDHAAALATAVEAEQRKGEEEAERLRAKAEQEAKEHAARLEQAEGGAFRYRAEAAAFAAKALEDKKAADAQHVAELKKLLMDAENNVEEVGEKADAAKQAAIAAEAAAAVAEEKRKGGKFF